MISKYLKRIARLESFEIKNNSFVFLLIAPGIYIYSVLILWYNPSAIELPYQRELFAVLFFTVGLLPMFKKRFLINYYGLLIFGTLFLFQHYLIYTTALNNFSLDYLLGTFIVMFGTILMLNSRALIVVFSASQLLHMGYWVFTSNLSPMKEGAILISITTIFIYSFIILNGVIRYRRKLEAINVSLEDRVKSRTEDLEKRAKELYERNKDLEDFAYVVSHDLKRPLRNIHTLADWLTEEKEGTDKEEESGDSLKLIKEQVEQMDLFINGILNYSLQIKGTYLPKEVNTSKVLEELVKLNTETNVDIIVNSKLPNVIYNEFQITQVFHNLIDNAIKHNDRDNVEINIGFKDEDEYYLFYVKDNGPGIEKKYHEKIFQLFQRLQETDLKSIGLGLSLVKKIIKRNKGKLWVESEKGSGATFFFTVNKK